MMGVVWTVLGLTALAALVALVARSTHKREAVQSVRRRLLIGACLCAASLVAACRGFRANTPPTQQPPARLSVLAHLGEIWRVMTWHSTGQVRDEPMYRALGTEMEAALEDLRLGAHQGRIRHATAAALDAAFRERHYHIWRTRYSSATCYHGMPLSDSLRASREAVDQQIATLDQLAATGKVPALAVAQARAAIAQEVAFQSRVTRLRTIAERQGEEAKEAQEALYSWKPLVSQDTTAPTPASTQAARILVDFTAEPTDSS